MVYQKRLVGDSEDEMDVDDQAAQDSFAEDSDDPYAPAKRTATTARKTAVPAKKASAKGKGKEKEQNLVRAFRPLSSKIARGKAHLD